MNGYLPKEFCVIECPEPDLNAEINFRRQPARVDLLITGDKRDVDKVFHELISRFNNLPYGVDFEVTPTSTKVILHPWAIND